MRNVLISVLGSTPQILTETLWCLKVQKGVDIDEIVVITTSYGKNLIVNGTKKMPPLIGKGGVLEKFCKEFKTHPKFPEKNILVIKNKYGNELEDIRNTDDNECAANFITSVIREFAKRNDVVIHCSVAGGRKTMSVFAGLAMTLVGRKQDHLYHVLVSPQEIEGNPKFFYKPLKPVLIETESGKISTDSVEITLAEIPFLRLGEKYGNIFPTGVSYTEIVERVQNYENISEAVVKADADEVEIVGRNKKFRDALKLIERYAKTKGVDCVLLIGESGTGKELFAKYFAKVSGKQDKFFTLNCAGFTDDLISSELFGHVKGAFTGAVRDKKGIFAEHNNGVVFLDEINKTTPKFQGVLLRFLDSGEIRKVGSNVTERVNLRLIIGLNEDPKEWQNRSVVLNDFLNRISRHVVKIPPLRERKDDIPELVKYFVKKYSAKYGKKVEKISDNVMEIFKAYDWRSGNVRELENCIADMIARADEDETMLSNLPEDFEVNIKAQIENFESQLSEISRGKGLNLSLDELMKAYIEYQLAKNNWNISKTAEILGIKRSTLYDKMKKLGISR